MIEGNAGYAYRVAKKYAYLNRRWKQIDEEDLLQASLVGLIEAVDGFNPDKGRFTTYAHFLIFKRIWQEIYRLHWTVMKPPVPDMQSFFNSKMQNDDPDRADAYAERFILNNKSDTHHDRRGHSLDEGYQLVEFESLVAMANLTTAEMAVFNNYCHGTSMNLLDENQINGAEQSMFEKLHKVLASG